MAFALFKDGHKQTIGHDKSLQVWAVLNGEVQGTEQQQAYCDSIERLYLAWDTAPSSYKQKYPRYQPSEKQVVMVPLQYKDSE